MSASIVPQLVLKDFRLHRSIILVFALVVLLSAGLVSFLIGRIPDWVALNLGFILLLGPAATCGIVLLMKSNVFEKEKSTQAFIMSLPVTVREFTKAKLLLNLPVFGLFWLAVSAAGFYFAFGRGLFPLGAVPFVTMVFLGVLLSYTCILSTSLVSQSLGLTVLSIALFEMVTSAYLWTIAYLEGTRRYIWGSQIVWTPMFLAIVAAQILAAAGVIAITLHLQNRKRDFI
ncbi:hypothetical protein ABAC460_21150 [Asticcacaulis sp. AC460]|uniref:hypothetical protein n=1 Tax=Asticcacaulis sp. AC460 TaxID=1282360 RepID=UPI0003C3B20F|nr:hypothetical protein [Asticcacaulis sp. AC460]ESQ87079.1 hypothetical protein ABAC460_21150 [Asticcacaulis sp. AC460]